MKNKISISTIEAKGNYWRVSGGYKTLNLPPRCVILQAGATLPEIFYAKENERIAQFVKAHPRVKELVLTLQPEDYILWLESRLAHEAAAHAATIQRADSAATLARYLFHRASPERVQEIHKHVVEDAKGVHFI